MRYEIDYLTRSRTLFLLHQKILSGNIIFPEEAVATQEHISLPALQTAIKMMADVAYDHVCHITLHNNVDALPLCCSYNFQAAMQASNDVCRRTGYETSPVGLESVIELVKIFRKRWKSSLS